MLLFFSLEEPASELIMQEAKMNHDVHNLC